MTTNDLTNKVILILGLTDYHKPLIENYVLDAIDYMRSAGVDDSVIYSQRSVGAIVMYVNDSWNYTQGQTKVSSLFKERVNQLSLAGDDEDV